MLCIQSLSGQEVAAYDRDELARLEESAGSAVRGIKRQLESSVMFSRFRQILLRGDEVLEEDACLELPLVLQLVISEYREPEAGKLPQLLSALARDAAREVDAWLRRPHDPDLVHEGQTGLLRAASSGAVDCVRLFLEAGADREKPAGNGATPLVEASRRGFIEIVRLLAECRADLNKSTQDGTTPLAAAAGSGRRVRLSKYYFKKSHLKVARLLMELGADKDKARLDGATPLIIAVSHGDFAMVRLLVEAAANVDKHAEQGETPLFVAAQNGHDKIMRLLIRAGANADKARTDGATPASIAAQRHSNVSVACLANDAAESESVWQSPRSTP